MEFHLSYTCWSSVFPSFLYFKPEFFYEEVTIWATVSPRSCVCWLYTASPPSATKNVINLISILTIWWCPCGKLSLLLLKEYLLWLVHSLGRVQLAFVLLHSVAYFIPDSLYLLIPYLCVALPSIPFPTGNYQFVLYICDFASSVLYSLVFYIF